MSETKYNRRNRRDRKKRILTRLLIVLIIIFLLVGLAGILMARQKQAMEKQQKKDEAIAALASIPTVTPTPAATPTPTPTPIPTVTPTPVITRAPAFNPEDYMGVWKSENGKVTIQITELTEKTITFTYTQTNKKGTAVCEANVKKSVAGNAANFSFKDSLGNKAKGFLTFDNGRLYAYIKTRKKAEGAKVHPSVDGIMIRN